MPGKLIDEVSASLDGPVKQLGPGHRVLFHDPMSASAIGAAVAKSMGYPAQWGVYAAWLHLLEDSLISKIPQPWRAFIVQWLEEADGKGSPFQISR